jgi:hypothetical protein
MEYFGIEKELDFYNYSVKSINNNWSIKSFYHKFPHMNQK